MTLDHHSQQKPNYHSQYFGFTELTINPPFPHTAPVDANHRQTAKLRVFYPIYDGNTVTLRRFFFVCIMRKRFMPDMRGIQDGGNRNKRVVLIDDRSIWQLLPNSKIYEYEKMTAITLGNPAQKLAATLPTRKSASAQIVFNKSRTGYIAYRKGTPLAWLVLGYHQGQLNHQRKLVEFVDVAWHRQHERGISMETAFFDTLPEAMQFIRTTFDKVGAA